MNEGYDQNQNSTDDALLADARMGLRIEEFLASDVGRYLVDRGEAEEAAGIDALLAAEDGSKESQAARQRVGVARLFKTWLIEGVESGIAATLNLRLMENFDDE